MAVSLRLATAVSLALLVLAVALASLPQRAAAQAQIPLTLTDRTPLASQNIISQRGGSRFFTAVSPTTGSEWYTVVAVCSGELALYWNSNQAFFPNSTNNEQNVTSTGSTSSSARTTFSFSFNATAGNPMRLTVTALSDRAVFDVYIVSQPPGTEEIAPSFPRGTNGNSLSGPSGFSKKSHTITLRWTELANATSYSVFWSTGPVPDLIGQAACSARSWMNFQYTTTDTEGDVPADVDKRNFYVVTARAPLASTTESFEYEAATTIIAVGPAKAAAAALAVATPVLLLLALLAAVLL